MYICFKEGLNSTLMISIFTEDQFYICLRKSCVSVFVAISISYFKMHIFVFRNEGVVSFWQPGWFYVYSNTTLFPGTSTDNITQYLLIIMSRFKLNTRINTKDYDISQAESFDMQIFPRSLDKKKFNGKMLKWSLFIFNEKK